MDNEVFKDQHTGHILVAYFGFTHAGSTFDIPLHVRLQAPELEGLPCRSCGALVTIGYFMSLLGPSVHILTLTYYSIFLRISSDYLNE